MSDNNYLELVLNEKRQTQQTDTIYFLCLDWLLSIFMQYFNYNKDVLPRRTRSNSKLRLPFVKLECTKNALIM